VKEILAWLIFLGLLGSLDWSVSLARSQFPWSPFWISLHKCKNCCDFQKKFPMIPNSYLPCITWTIYNKELFVNVMPMDGSNYIFKKPASMTTYNNTINKFPRFLCLCSLVRLDEIFRVWWSWVGIINYIIKIVLVFDGFFNYHFEPRQNMRNSLFVYGFHFFQCPKELDAPQVPWWIQLWIQKWRQRKEKELGHTPCFLALRG